MIQPVVLGIPYHRTNFGLLDGSDRIVRDADIERPLLIPMNGILRTSRDSREVEPLNECGAPSMFWRVLH